MGQPGSQAASQSVSQPTSNYLSIPYFKKTVGKGAEPTRARFHYSQTSSVQTEVVS